MYRTLIEQPEATQAITDAAQAFPRVWEAFDGLKWELARVTPKSVAVEGQTVTFFVFKQQGSKLYQTPNLTILYMLDGQTLVICGVRISDPEA